MQKANHVFEALHKLGQRQAPVTRIYRQLFNSNMYLGAYAKIYSNKGALTKGTDDVTVDGFNTRRIESIINDMRLEKYRWKPARRTHVQKKSGGQRPLGIPNFRDRLVQEVIRAMLNAYYEPRFSTNSHGFRPERGCHTALAQVASQFTGTKWFIEGDIKGCFDNIDHDILMAILRNNIQDERLLNLIKYGLKAGVLENWTYNQTHSGTPQGGILSPLLSNIYLDKLDKYVEETLIPKWTRGKRRKSSKSYKSICHQIEKARAVGDWTEFDRLKHIQKSMPSQDINDPGYRRLWYVRYADDYLLGFVGSKKEAEQVKCEIATFLSEELKLTQSPEKTLITHATTQQAQFLGYAISVYHTDEKQSIGASSRVKRRCANGRVRLGIPADFVRKKTQKYFSGNVISSRRELTIQSVAEIIRQHQQSYRGIAEYYKYAVDRNRLSGLKGVMEVQLVKTIAHKMKISVSKVYRQYKATKIVDGKEYKILRETVETQKGTYQFDWGGIPLIRVNPSRETINDLLRKPTWSAGGELIERLKANKCEHCGSTTKVEVHHVRKLADLKKRWAGKREKPKWVKLMITRSRKTIVVCQKCHNDIHHGRLKQN
ncbi:MAG: reverse transcriptase/maturase family protein [Pseudomonadota bacterium]